MKPLEGQVALVAGSRACWARRAPSSSAPAAAALPQRTPPVTLTPGGRRRSRRPPRWWARPGGIAYHGQFFFDLMEISLKRLSYAIAQELAPKGVTALAITPGFMRTEAILQGFGVTEANEREAAEHNAEAKAWGFISSETPCFVGRAVAALAADPHVAHKSGGIYDSWSLSEEYGFTDLDG